jgi:hypothetical protein
MQNKVWEFEEAKKLMGGVMFNGRGCHLDGTVFQKNREIAENIERREQKR